MFQNQTLANNKNDCLDTLIESISKSKSNSPLKTFLDTLLVLFGPQILHFSQRFQYQSLTNLKKGFLDMSLESILN